MFRYQNLSRNKRWLIFTALFLLSTVLNVFDIAPDFFKGVMFGFVLALLLQEGVIYLNKKR
ncbi:hypothetical protein H7F15_17510 [Pontibacter sp. Tf4]|uniref:hypothetical protein n=1 Tax=Pontibacter sp. Tf4 TaxID=2761620 RepID=UPI0016270DBF|nr:hypothetical protein [Pontibacter sp. Tf4]MBB6612843.1 hypothetical protein [Pontibacter sp. Tf4]